MTQPYDAGRPDPTRPPSVLEPIPPPPDSAPLSEQPIEAYQPPSPPGQPAPPAYQPAPPPPPTYQPVYRQPAHPPAPYAPLGYTAYGYPPPRRGTESLAIISIVVSFLAVFGLCFTGVGGVLGAVGAVLGHVAQRRIRHDGTQGTGAAMAGILLGWAMAALGVAALVGFMVLTLVESATPE